MSSRQIKLSERERYEIKEGWSIRPIDPSAELPLQSGGSSSPPGGDARPRRRCETEILERRRRVLGRRLALLRLEGEFQNPITIGARDGSPGQPGPWRAR